MKWWRRRQRRIDREILWPIFENYFKTTRDVLFTKWMHVCSDSAWRYRSEWKDEEPELHEATKEGVFGL